MREAPPAKGEPMQVIYCKKCAQAFEYSPKDAIWDDNGYGYSTKLVRCKHCQTLNVIKILEDRDYKSRWYEE